MTPYIIKLIITITRAISAALLPDVKAAFMRRQANFEEQAKRYTVKLDVVVLICF